MEKAQMPTPEEIQKFEEILRKAGYSEKAIKEILKWYL